eukprot:10821094-Karenia_brevis.AAC.1
MDLAPMRAISKELGVLPFRINADKCCLFSRDRLHWCNFPFLPTDADVVREGPDYLHHYCLGRGSIPVGCLGA